MGTASFAEKSTPITLNVVCNTCTLAICSLAIGAVVINADLAFIIWVVAVVSLADLLVVVVVEAVVMIDT